MRSAMYVALTMYAGVAMAAPAAKDYYGTLEPFAARRCTSW